MRKLIFTCIAATLVAAPMTTIVKAEDTTVIKRDRDGEGDKTVIKRDRDQARATRPSSRRGRNLTFFQFPIRKRKRSSKKNATNSWASHSSRKMPGPPRSWLGQSSPSSSSPLGLYRRPLHQRRGARGGFANGLAAHAESAKRAVQRWEC